MTTDRYLRDPAHVDRLTVLPERVMITMQVPYERLSDGSWLAESESIDEQSLRDRIAALAEVETNRRRREWAAALRYGAADVRRAGWDRAANLLDDLAAQTEADILTPWATEPATTPAQTPHTAPTGPDPGTGTPNAHSGAEGAGEAVTDDEQAAPGWIARTWDRAAIDQLIARTWDRAAIDQLITALERAWTVDRQRQGAQLRALLADRDQLARDLAASEDSEDAHLAIVERQLADARAEIAHLERQRNAAQQRAHRHARAAEEEESAAIAARAEVERMRPVVDAARVVAEHWRDEAMQRGWTPTHHALAMVLAALDGETNPTELGIPDDHPDADRLAAAVDRYNQQEATDG